MGFCAPWWTTHTVPRRQPIWIFTPDQIKPFQLSVNISTTLQSIFRIENHRGRARPSSRRRRRGWRRISSWSSAGSASPWSPSSLLSSSWFSSSPVSCKHTWAVKVKVKAYLVSDYIERGRTRSKRQKKSLSRQKKKNLHFPSSSSLTRAHFSKTTLACTVHILSYHHIIFIYIYHHIIYHLITYHQNHPCLQK